MPDLKKYNLTIISQIEIPNVVIVKLNSLKVVEVVWSEFIGEIEKKHLIQLRDVIQEIGNGNKMLIYIDTYNFMDITNEARKYAASKESNLYTLANAVLVDSLPKKLLFNFFLRFENPIVPTKGFSTKEEAMEWLQQLQF